MRQPILDGFLAIGGFGIFNTIAAYLLVRFNVDL